VEVGVPLGEPVGPNDTHLCRKTFKMEKTRASFMPSVDVVVFTLVKVFSLMQVWSIFPLV
jgi:hypothetical protein